MKQKNSDTINAYIKKVLASKKCTIVNIGEYKVSLNERKVLKACALGSCVAAILYDRIKKIGGMIHIALPDSSLDDRKGLGYYADTGLSALLERMVGFGASRKNIRAKIVGGANVLNISNDIGKSNIIAVKKILKKSNIQITADHTGDTIARTASFFLDTGKVIISSGKKKWEI